MNRKLVAIFALLLAFMFLISACSSETNSAPAPTNTGSAAGTATSTAASTAAGTDVKLTEFDRSETLYFFSGMGAVPNSFNPMDGAPAWPFARLQQELMYETLFMMNIVTGELEPLVGDSYETAKDNSITVKINAKAAFNDGSDLTAKDAKYSIELGKKYAISWSSYWKHIDNIEVVDDKTFIVHQKPADTNTPQTLDMLQNVPMLPEAVWSKVEADAGNDIANIRKFTNNVNPVASGPYMLYSFNDQSIVVKRNDNYWGVVRFGKLPAPKYIMHPIYKSNDAAIQDFKDNKVDINQSYIPKIWTLKEQNKNIGTYLNEAPYYVPGVMPSLIINVHKKGLDNATVRKALAYSINYKQIAEAAMSNYTADMQPMLNLPNGIDDKYVDKSQLASLQWSYDPAKANQLLDQLGAKKGADGIRVLPDGTRMSWELQSAYGWTDWNATMEVVSQSAKAIGVELKPTMPESAVFTSNRQTGNFDISMASIGEGARPSQPWYRYKAALYDKDIPKMGEMAVSNEGRFHNDRANEIIDRLPGVTDPAELTKLNTEINKIFLEEVPVIPVMYRPYQFYQFNSTYWTGFPTSADGKNIPPNFDRMAGVKLFYEIQPVKSK